MSKDPDQATRDKVVELYEAGTRLVDITAETGVPRPSIYWILETRGIRPNRQRTAASPGSSEAGNLARTAVFVAELLLERLNEYEDASEEAPALVKKLAEVREEAKKLL